MLSHETVNWLLTVSDVPKGLARLPLRQSEFGFNIVHRAGIKYQAVVALFILLTVGFKEFKLENEIPVLNINRVAFGIACSIGSQ